MVGAGLIAALGTDRHRTCKFWIRSFSLQPWRKISFCSTESGSAQRTLGSCAM